MKRNIKQNIAAFILKADFILSTHVLGKLEA